MILTEDTLLEVDAANMTDDVQSNTYWRSLVHDIVDKHGHPKFPCINIRTMPIYWYREIHDALTKMTNILPDILFIDIKNINYGIRIHHTSTTATLAQLNGIKLDLACRIDQLILTRVRAHIRKK